MPDIPVHTSTLPALSETAIQSFIDQIMNTFIVPELQQRKERGVVSLPHPIAAVQVLLFADDRQPVVRINEEVRFNGRIRFKSGITRQPGEPIASSDIESIDSIRLQDVDDPDCAHITIIQIEGRWYLSFNFIYNKGFSRQHIEASEQFLLVAKYCYRKSYRNAFYDTLFSSAELAVKALLLGFPDPDFRKDTSHGQIRSNINRWAQLGNINTEHTAAFNKLVKYRDKARYLKGAVGSSKVEQKELLRYTESLISIAKTRAR